MNNDYAQMIKLFDIPKNFTKEQLRQAYKRLIIKYHPDKTMKLSDTPVFQELTRVYKLLLDALNLRLSEPQHADMKARFNEVSLQEQPPQPPPMASDSKKKFDSARFNNVFMQTRLEDANDYGYDEWRSNAASFNERSSVILHTRKEPVPMTLNLDSQHQYYELGATKCSDFSSTQSATPYMDFRVAHTTTTIIPDDSSKRKEFQSIEDLQRERGKLTHIMSPHELMRVKRRQLKDEAREEHRLRRLKEHDASAQAQYQKAHNLLQGPSERKRVV